MAGALRAAFRLYERWKALDGWSRERNRSYPLGVDADGLAIPPEVLRVRVAGTADIFSFLDGGEKGAQTVRALLRKSERPVESCRAILDFGCGCGRVLRFWNGLAGVEVYGTDLDRELIGWCGERLPFARVSLNSPEPPTHFRDGQFDAIYAFSVFTHMPADLQFGWLREFRRILASDGVLIFSTHGCHYLPRLSVRERGQFEEGKLVVRFASAAGSNLCNAYHPEKFVRNELSLGWEIVAFEPEGARGNPRQDAWVFRRAGEKNHVLSPAPPV